MDRQRYQCCQMAEILKSSEGAGEKLSWPEEFVAEFWKNFTKSGRKGAGEYFLKKFLTKWY
jgi:hypothetical protein